MITQKIYRTEGIPKSADFVLNSLLLLEGNNPEIYHFGAIFRSGGNHHLYHIGKTTVLINTAQRKGRKGDNIRIGGNLDEIEMTKSKLEEISGVTLKEYTD